MEPIHENVIHKIKNSINNIQTSLEIIKGDISPESDNYHTIKIALEEVGKLYKYVKQLKFPSTT